MAATLLAACCSLLAACGLQLAQGQRGSNLLLLIATYILLAVWELCRYTDSNTRFAPPSVRSRRYHYCIRPSTHPARCIMRPSLSCMTWSRDQCMTSSMTRPGLLSGNRSHHSFSGRITLLRVRLHNHRRQGANFALKWWILHYKSLIFHWNCLRCCCWQDSTGLLATNGMTS